MLHTDLIEATQDDVNARRAVLEAFPSGAAGVGSAVAHGVPFVADPVAAVRAEGPVRLGVAAACADLVAAFLAGVALRVCGGLSVALAEETLGGLSLPEGCSVWRLVGPIRSSAQDAEAAGCALLDGVCVVNESAPRGAEADARVGMA